MPERKVRFFVGWVEPDLRCWVSPPPADQPTKIRHLSRFNFKRRNPTNRFSKFWCYHQLDRQNSLNPKSAIRNLKSIYCSSSIRKLVTTQTNVNQSNCLSKERYNMPKVGILGCEATTRDMDCVMIGGFGKRVDHPAGRYAPEDERSRLQAD